MPQTINSFGDTGQDREIDELWTTLRKQAADIAALQAILGKPAPPATTSSTTDATITVQDITGDPSIQCLGLQFDANDGFTLTESGGLAQVNLVTGGVLSSIAPPDVAAAGSAGTSPQGTHSDHTHKGVHSVAKSGGAALYGDITLTGSGAVTVTQAGQNIDINATSGGSTFTPPLTTKGDLYTRSNAADARLPAGTNGQILSADSTQATGLKWTAAASSGNVVLVNDKETALAPAAMSVGAFAIGTAVIDQTYFTYLEFRVVAFAPSNTFSFAPSNSTDFTGSATEASIFLFNASGSAINVTSSATMVGGSFSLLNGAGCLLVAVRTAPNTYDVYRFL